MNEKNVVKMSHELNHFRGGYTRLELDFIFAFISTIKDEDEDFRPYILSLADLEKKLGKRLQLSKMQYLFKSLITKTFEVNNEEELGVYSFFTSIVFKKEANMLFVKFNPDLKPHLIELYNKVTNKEGRLFAQGDLRYILEYRSEYTKRLYMILAQWRKAGKMKIEVATLREMLDVPKEYKYSNFKQKVLNIAEKEMLKKGDLFFEYEEKKLGRRVHELIFRVKTKDAGQAPIPAEQLFEEAVGKEIYHEGYEWTITSAYIIDNNIVKVKLYGERGDREEEFGKTQLQAMIEERLKTEHDKRQQVFDLAEQ